YGLHTDASHRFERGVDPTLARQALEWATDLILEILGGEAGPVIGAEHPEALPQPKSIFLRESRLKTLLGRSVPADQVNAILKGLSLSPERQTEGWSVRVPSFRFDLNLEVDLIEEIARIVGFETFTPELPMTHWVNEGFSEKKLPSLRIKTLLADRGFLEAITYSFIDPKWKPWFYGEVTSPTLTNPISPDMAQMRGSLLPGLLEAVKNNRNRQMSRVHLFEMGRVFHDPLEIERLAAVKFGDQRAIEWDGNRLVDYFDLKGDLEAVLTLTHQKVSFKSAEDVQYLHPGQSARVFLEEKPIGVIGKLHPNVIRFLDFKGDIFVFEIDLAEVLSTQKPAFAPISKYPSIARDLALVVDEVLPVADILNAVRSSMGSILVDLNVFDVYAGAGIPEGKKSVALSLILQDLSHTLTELDINEKMNQLLSMLSTQFKATLRE
ncbi:MAG: phenylalanine--tRNA ligase subunit beta, partial [Gammaproteobacteria bacterium]|nr:phenylalanine--tRNA ligase subunit beta [Gammaproteobacteria bacterium]